VVVTGRPVANAVAAARRFLLVRGIWLVLLGFTVVNFGVWFDIRFCVFVFYVIAAFRACFFFLSFLLGCLRTTISVIRLAIIFLHNLAPLVPGSEGSFFKVALMPLLAPGAYPIGGRLFIMGYPPVPWLGVMLVGFASGRFFLLEPSRQRSLFL